MKNPLNLFRGFFLWAPVLRPPAPLRSGRLPQKENRCCKRTAATRDRGCLIADLWPHLQSKGASDV